MLPKPKIVFLYSEIAGYFLACAKALSKYADVLIVRWPINSEAPFKFDVIDGVKIVCKADYSTQELRTLIKEFKPTTLVCSGWMDKDYLTIVKSFKKTIPTVLTLDNHWTGSLKQRLACLASPFLLRNKFTHVWVPGKPQTIFAKALGFKNISTGFYCADVDLHQENYNENHLEIKHQFLYVGRYVKHKAIFEMWQAFIELAEENKFADWEMICVGAGEEFDNKTEHPKIKHLGFIQPKDLKQLVESKPVYILPSSFEPWGVSVQEFAIAGCPLIISEKVGASALFLKVNENGYSIKPTVESIKEGMLKMMGLQTNALKNMAEKSHELGMSYQPKDWAKKILKFKI